MPNKYFCAHCDEEFSPEESTGKPRCPRCMRRTGVDRVRETPEGSRPNRRWLMIAGFALAAIAIGYGAFRLQAVSLEERPPVRPLEPRELAAYLERDQIQAGAYSSMFALSRDVNGWPTAPDELATRLNAESSTWSLERTLSREVLTADQTLGAMVAQVDRVRLYPLEVVTTMVALLRRAGTPAMVAEVWELEGEQAPADPSGILGYFVTAVYERGDDEPSAFYDPWGGRGEVKPASARVLRDPEAIGAALGIEATRIFSRSGDGVKALPMVEAALRLDPTSPSLRVAYATVLVESGGLPQATQELEAAIQLRPDGPRELNVAQLMLAQATMLEATGQPSQAEALFTEANRKVVEVIDQWPRYGRAHLILATVHLGLRDRDRARVELEAAEALSPESPMLWAVWAQFHLAGDDPASATAAMNRAIKLDPENWQLRAQAAGIFYRADDDDLARAQADEALRLVAQNRKAELRNYLDEMLGSADPDPGGPEGAPSAATLDTGGADPVLMLGDPSKVRLRDPGQALKLDLDE